MGSKQAKIIRKELRKAGMGAVMKNVEQQAKDELVKVMYNKLKANLKPKPKWMPKFIHTYLVNLLFEVRSDATS